MPIANYVNDSTEFESRLAGECFNLVVDDLSRPEWPSYR